MANNLNYFKNNNIINLHMFFVIDGTTYALPSDHVLEIIKLPSLDNPQKMPNGLIGLLSYNALTLPAIDLRYLLQLEPKSYNIDNLLVIVKTEESIFSIIVDKVVSVYSIEQSDMQPPPYVSENNLIRFLYHFENEVVSVIDLYAVERVLKQNEAREYTFDKDKYFPTDEHSVSVLQERSKRLSSKRSYGIESFYSLNQFVTFALDEGNYCLDLKCIKEIAKLKSFTMIRIPCAPDYIAGIINLRGDFITVIDFKVFLGMKSRTKELNNKIIVIDSKEFKIALLVDEIFSILNIADEQMSNKADSKFETDSKYVKAEFVKEQELYTIINFEKVLEDEKLFIEDSF